MTESGLVARDPATGAVKWKARLNAAGEPAVAPDGSILVLGYDPIDGGDNNSLVSFDPSGHLQWRYVVAPGGSVGTAAPVIGRDGTIAFAAFTKVVAVTKSGQLAWAKPFEDGGFTEVLGVDEGDTLYLLGPGGVSGVDLATGTTKWSLSKPVSACDTQGPSLTLTSKGSLVLQWCDQLFGASD